jgi:hypothetical protein
MKLTTTLLIASAFAANANWFTELFESEEDRIARTIGTPEQVAELQDLAEKSDQKRIEWERLHANCTTYKCVVPDLKKKDRCTENGYHIIDGYLTFGPWSSADVNNPDR